MTKPFVQFCILVITFALISNGGNASDKTSQVNRLMTEANQMLWGHSSARAAKVYQQVLKIDPGNARAYADLGWITFERGEVGKGMRQERQAIALDPKLGEPHHYLAAMYLSVNNPQAAADQYRAEIAADPKRKCNCLGIINLMKKYPPKVRSKKAGAS